jgi:hypothetical protein
LCVSSTESWLEAAAHRGLPQAQARPVLERARVRKRGRQGRECHGKGRAQCKRPAKLFLTVRPLLLSPPLSPAVPFLLLLLNFGCSTQEGRQAAEKEGRREGQRREEREETRVHGAERCSVSRCGGVLAAALRRPAGVCSGMRGASSDKWTDDAGEQRASARQREKQCLCRRYRSAASAASLQLNLGPQLVLVLCCAPRLAGMRRANSPAATRTLA